MTEAAENLSEGARSTTLATRLGTIVADTYRIDRLIGSGGSGHVYRSEHLRLGRSFALKLLRDVASTRAHHRFKREARAIAQVRSEYVVEVIDCGELPDETPYLVMELLEGEDLRSLLSREHSLPARRAVQLAIDACRGLVAIHHAKLVHRDLKPENLFVCRRESGEDWCKVLDLGVVKMASTLSTAQGAILGTVRYMAPEQLADGDSVTAAADVYALGAVLYEALAGRPPHDGNSVQEIMFSVMNREPTPLEQVCPSLPSSLIAIVAQCLSKNPAHRPRGIELSQLLQRTLMHEAPCRMTDLTLCEPCDRIAPDGTSPRKLRIRWMVGTALLAALTTWFAKPSDQPEAPVPAAAPQASTMSEPAPPPTTSPAIASTVVTMPTPVPAKTGSRPATPADFAEELRRPNPLRPARPAAVPAQPRTSATTTSLQLGLDAMNPYEQ